MKKKEYQIPTTMTLEIRQQQLLSGSPKVKSTDPNSDLDLDPDGLDTPDL